jgi:hypothetical protein
VNDVSLLKALPNRGAAGIQLLSTATQCLVGSNGDEASEAGMWIAGNLGDGIQTNGVSVRVRRTMIGINQLGEPTGNAGYGILVEGAATDPTVTAQSTIGSNGLCGIRVGVDSCWQSINETISVETSCVCSTTLNYTETSRDGSVKYKGTSACDTIDKDTALPFCYTDVDACSDGKRSSKVQNGDSSHLACGVVGSGGTIIYKTIGDTNSGGA